MTQGDVAVFMHDGRYHIRPARAASCGEAEADTRAHEHTAYDAGHELLVGQQMGLFAAHPLDNG